MDDDAGTETKEKSRRERLSAYAPPFPLAPRRLIEMLALGARSLGRYKLRSFLTTLGIVFGVGAVVSMMSVAAGASQELLDEIHSMGIRNILLESVKPPEERQAEGGRGRVKEYGLRERDVRVLSSTAPLVDTLVRGHRVMTKAYLGDRQVESTILGVEPAYFDALDLEVASGRPLVPLDEENLTCVCVIGPKLFSELGGLGDPVGQTIRIGEVFFRICGVLAGPETGSEALDIFIPYGTSVSHFGYLQMRFGSGSMEASRVEVSRLVLRCRNIYMVLPAASVVEHVLKRLHGNERDYEITVPLKLLEQAERTQRVFQVVMILIAGISLIVGGIGIANIMFASVMERTREIGIRRALGARETDILSQFLTETVLIALLGGAAGCLAGVGGSWLIAEFTGWPYHLSPGPFLLALLISCAVGILAGLAPARRAAKLDPVSAFQHE